MESTETNSKNRKVAFLDRDGVVNVDTGYIFRPPDVVWIEGAIDAIRLLNQNRFDVVIVTNQSGIARGYYTEDQFEELTHWMEQELFSKGAVIKKTVYCPHHPTEGQAPYRIDCDCRKPKPGMLNSVLDGSDYDKSSSFLIGDKQTDVEAAKAAGIRGFRFSGTNLLTFLESIPELAGT